MQEISKERKELHELLNDAGRVAREAGIFLLAHSKSVLKSEGKDIKLIADIDAHELLRSALKTTDIPILSEEDTVHDFTFSTGWIIDPLDGSLNFSRGIPNCAVSIALMENAELVLGVIYDFNRDELYTGLVGEGAWMNGERIFVSVTEKKSDAVIMSGFPSDTHYETEALQEYISFVQSFKKMRLIGSAALSLSYVASGKADVYYERDIKVWDVAAGLALVRSAGGIYTINEVDEKGGCTIFASNGILRLDE